MHPHITGMTTLSGKVIVSEFKSECRLTLFDENGKILSSIVSHHYVSAITNVGDERFATCGTDKKVRLFVLCDDSIVREGTSFDVDHIAFGRVIEFGFDIHMDNVTHAIYVPCWMNDGGVLCVSVECEPLWLVYRAELQRLTVSSA